MMLNSVRQVVGRQKINIKPKIGLEVHAQLNTKSKLFSRGGNISDAAPNSQLDLLDVAIPGSLPVLNRSAFNSAIATALGLNCTIQDEIHFDRKNYFYTDMPAGFQITQYNKPIAKDGYIDFIVKTYHRSIIAHSQQYDIVKYIYHQDRLLSEEFVPYVKRSQIKQIQLEQDSAKTLSEEGDFDLVDYNRSGAGLIEIVFEPDLSNPHEASSLVRDLIIILKQLRTCNCELQEGSLRVDANVSIESIENQTLPEQDAGRVELKNLNSLRALTKGIGYEIKRQADELTAGQKVPSETRTYDSKSGKTKLLRLKETAMDYRYVPEPSIPPLRIDPTIVEAIKRDVEQQTFPSTKRELLKSKFDLDLILISELIEEPGLVEYFLKVMKEGSEIFDANVVADFLIYAANNLKGTNLPIQVDLQDLEGDFYARLSPVKMGQLFSMMFAEEISFSTAFEVAKCLFTSNSPSDPRQFVDQLGWWQLNDEQKIESMCESVSKGMKNVSKQYKKKGDRKYLRMMLEKLCETHDNRLNVRLAIKYLDERLRNEDK